MAPALTIKVVLTDEALGPSTRPLARPWGRVRFFFSLFFLLPLLLSSFSVSECRALLASVSQAFQVAPSPLGGARSGGFSAVKQPGDDASSEGAAASGICFPKQRVAAKGERQTLRPREGSL